MKKHIRSSKRPSQDANLSRRDFIKVAGVFAGSAVLAACASQVTVTSEVTVTLPPTITPSPTETPSPSFPPEIQEKFKDSKVFKLNIDGTITVLPQEEGGEERKIKGLTVNPEGQITLRYGEGENDTNKQYVGKEFTIDPTTLAIDDTEKRIKFSEPEAVGGMQWIVDEATGSKHPEITTDMIAPEGFFVLHDFNYIKSKEFDERIIQFGQKERFVPPTGEEIPLEKGDISPNIDTSFASTTGYVSAFEMTSQAKMKYKNKQEIPVRIVGIYKVKTADGFEGELIVERWTDKSGEPKYRKVFEPWRKNPDTPAQLLALSTELGYNTANRFPCGRIIIRTGTVGNFANNNNLANPDKFVDAYLKHKEAFEKYHKIYGKLSQSGVLDNSNGIPLVIAKGTNL